MENKLAQVFQIDSEKWLATLPKYQEIRIKDLLVSFSNSYEEAAQQWLNAPKYQEIRIKDLVNFSNSYEEAAQQWLNTMPENTFPLGAEPAKNVLIIEKVRDEIEKFLSGHEKYAEEQKQLVSSSEELQKTLVSSLSKEIAPVIGIAAAYVMPVIVLQLMTMSKIADRPIAIAEQTSNAMLSSESDLEDDMRWDQSFSRSPDVLAKLAATAMTEYHAGKTQELDPEKL